MKAGTTNSQRTSTARQRYGKHVSAVMNSHAIMEEFLIAVFPIRTMPRQYRDNQLRKGIPHNHVYLCYMCDT